MKTLVPFVPASHITPVIPAVADEQTLRRFLRFLFQLSTSRSHATMLYYSVVGVSDPGCHFFFGDLFYGGCHGCLSFVLAE